MEDPEPKDILELMIQDHAWDILAWTSVQSMSAKELQERCEVSERTIYRRLDELETAGLLQSQMEIDPDGHHRQVYSTSLKTVLLELENGTYEVRVQLEDDTADRFAQMWRDIRGE